MIPVPSGVRVWLATGVGEDITETLEGAKHKHYSHLDLVERIELLRHHDAGTAPSEIARIMGRHPSTIGRELKRAICSRSASTRSG